MDSKMSLDCVVQDVFAPFTLAICLWQFQWSLLGRRYCGNEASRAYPPNQLLAPYLGAMHVEIYSCDSPHLYQISFLITPLHPRQSRPSTGACTLCIFISVEVTFPVTLLLARAIYVG